MIPDATWVDTFENESEASLKGHADKYNGCVPGYYLHEEYYIIDNYSQGNEVEEISQAEKDDLAFQS